MTRPTHWNGGSNPEVVMKLVAGLLFVLSVMSLIPRVTLGECFSKCVPVTRVSAPEMVAPGQNRVVLFPFPGRIPGEQMLLADLVRVELTRGAGSEHWPWLVVDSVQVVEREALKRVLDELRLPETGLFDMARLKQVGRLLQADVVIRGKVAVTGLRPSDPSGPYGGTEWKDHEGKHCDYLRVGRGDNQEMAAAEAVMDVVDVETGSIESRSVRHGCLKELTWQLAALLKPMIWVEKKSLMDFRTDDRALRKRAQEADRLAQRGEIQRARAEYLSLAQADAYNAAGFFNLGLLAECVGNVEEADSLYSKALELAPDRGDGWSGTQGYYRKMITDGAQRITANRAALARAGISAVTTPWTSAASEGMPARIRGGSDKRVRVYGSPSNRGEVVAAVPGGLKVQILAEQGEYTQVRLPDGKVGWVLGEALVR